MLLEVGVIQCLLPGGPQAVAGILFFENSPVVGAANDAVAAQKRNAICGGRVKNVHAVTFFFKALIYCQLSRCSSN